MPETAPAILQSQDTVSQAAPAAAQPGQAIAHQDRARFWVLTGTGHPQFDSLLRGTLGTLDASGAFQTDPDYARLSYLFTLAPGSGLPAVTVVRPGSVSAAADADGVLPAPQSPGSEQIHIEQRTERAMLISMPAGAAAAYKANMIHACAAQWGALYDSFLGSLTANSMPARMLTAERDNVKNHVDLYISGLGLQEYEVPVLTRHEVWQDGSYATERACTEAELLARAGAAMSVMPDITRMPTLVAAAPAGDDQGDGQAPAAVSPPLPESALAHQGYLDVVAEGSIRVLASSPEAAAIVASALLATSGDADPHAPASHELLQLRSQIHAAFKPTPHNIQSMICREQPTESDEDDLNTRQMDRDYH